MPSDRVHCAERCGHMPDNVLQTSAPEWSPATEQLAFQFGPWVFGRWRFASLINRTSPLLQKEGAGQVPPILQPVTYQQMLDKGNISRTLCFDRGAIRYVPYRGKRYCIDLSSGSFTKYLANFSSNTRNRMKRQLRYFASHSGGKVDFRSYASPDEIIEFREHAIAVSRLSYQSRMGWGFPETDDFRAQLRDEAQNGRARGYLLMQRDGPVAFGLCRADGDVLTYVIIGYDPKFAKFSPGTILLLRIIEDLFTEQRFRLFDLGGHGTDFKAFHATGSVDYARVIWFPTTPKHFILVGVHHSLHLAWHLAARIKRMIVYHFGETKVQIGRHLRRQSARHGGSKYQTIAERGASVQPSPAQQPPRTGPH